MPGIPPEPDSIFEITRNSGRARIDKLEVTGALELDGLGMSGGVFTLGGTFQDSSLLDPVTGERHAESYSQPWMWTASLQQSLDNGALRWSIALADQSTSFGWMPHYFERHRYTTFLNAGISWKPIPGWTFSGGVNNILGQEFVATADFFETPRTVGALPDYRERSTSSTQRFFYLGLRKNF